MDKYAIKMLITAITESENNVKFYLNQADRIDNSKEKRNYLKMAMREIREQHDRVCLVARDLEYQIELEE